LGGHEHVRSARQAGLRRHIAATALPVVLAGAAVLSGGCSAGGVPDGTAFTQHPALITGNKPIRPGFEFGLLDDFLENSSRSTLVIDSVDLSGPGIGRVVRPVEVAMAPLRYGHHRYEYNATPESFYYTDPPVIFSFHRCHRQALFRLRGFRMTPGSQARLWIVLRTLRPGRWVIPARVVYYTINGVRYRQSEPVREWGSVSDRAVNIPPDWAEAQCVGPATGARLLSGYHLGKGSR
jgi:hypothetical protein